MESNWQLVSGLRISEFIYEWIKVLDRRIPLLLLLLLLLLLYVDVVWIPHKYLYS